jgi:NADH-quinone oxidoreductase subunit M
MRDVFPRELLAFAPIIALTVAVGVFPKPVFVAVNPAIARTYSFLNVEPVQPDVPVGDAGPDYSATEGEGDE